MYLRILEDQMDRTVDTLQGARTVSEDELSTVLSSYRKEADSLFTELVLGTLERPRYPRLLPRRGLYSGGDYVFLEALGCRSPLRH